MRRYEKFLDEAVVVYDARKDIEICKKSSVAYEESLVYALNNVVLYMLSDIKNATQYENGYYFYIEAPCIQIKLCKEGDVFTQGIVKMGKVAFSNNLLRKLYLNNHFSVIWFLSFLEKNIKLIREMLTNKGVPVDTPMTKSLLEENGIVDILGLYEYENDFKDIIERLEKQFEEVF